MSSMRVDDLDCMDIFCFSGNCELRALPVLTPSFPTRRSSDLRESTSPALRMVDNVSRLGTRSGAKGPNWAVTAARAGAVMQPAASGRSEEHTSELQSLMRISYAVLCLKKKIIPINQKIIYKRYCKTQ